ncbi:MAG TPA: gliding motility-associated C-terminal domain-containing protein [Bacteroidia bacterium]
MKKILLVTIGILLLLNPGMFAADRYWVNGTGAWNDPSHWSVSSGGAGGASVPTASDNAYFDELSSDDSGLYLTLNGILYCRDLVISEDLGAVEVVGNSSSRLEISGSVSFSDYVRSSFSGELRFTGNGTRNINFNKAMPKGNIRFAGSASSVWNIQSDLIMPFTSSVMMEGGTVVVSGKNIQALGIQWLGTVSKSIDLTSCKMVLAQPLNESGINNSTVIKNNTVIYPRASGLSRVIDSIQTAIVAPLCNTSSDGSISVTVFSAGPGPFGFVWAGPGCPCSGNPLNGIANGSYLLTITDSSDFETFQQFVQVIAPNPIGANFVRRRPKCFGNCNGSITANIVVGSGTAPYTFSWNTTPGQNTQTATNLCAGTYVLTVTDDHNCVQNFTQNLTQPAVVVANPTSTNLTCNGVCNGTATAAPTGGNTPFNYTYSWASAPPFATQTTQSISSLCAGTYTVTVRDDSLCQGTGTVTITEPVPLVITPSSSNITCNGACDGTADVAPVSGGISPYTFTWNPAGAGPTLSNLCPGTYSVVVADQNSCTQTASFTITQPNVFTASATGVNVTCNGLSNGSVTATVAGGTGPFTYDWNPGPAPVTTASTTNTLPSRPAGTYTVNVTDANGCTATATVTITEPAVLQANPVPVNVTCFGLCNGSVTAAPTGGTPAYTYVWTGSTPGPYAGQGTPTITSLCPGTYTVTVTDAQACVSTQSVTITQPLQLTIVLTKTNVTCNGACDGTMTATVSDGTAPYSYVWTGSTPGPYAGQGTQTITGLCPGTYTVTVTDANGCTRTATTNITQPNVLNAALTATSLSCNLDCDATITSTVSGGTPGYSFSWFPGGQTTPSITNQCAGVYTLTVTDANGCTRVVSITISEPTSITLVTSSSNVTCFGLSNGSASAIAGGGTPTYDYLWTPGLQTTSTITNKPAGTYTVTVTDNNNCTATTTVTITEPAQLLGNPTVTQNVTCAPTPCNGSATSMATGGTTPYTYNWTPGNPPGDGTPTVTGLCAGNYNLVVTDANNCASNQAFTITQPPVLTAPITNNTSSCTVCNGSATVTPAGGLPPYTFSWSDGLGQTTQTAVNLCPNQTYTVTVTDASNCTATGVVTITQTVTITITTSNTTLSCFGACDGIATANPAGGNPPYSYLWVDSSSPPQTVGVTSTVTGLCAGSYTVTVVDFDGCLNTDSVTFTNPPVLNVSTTQVNASCGGTCDGTATANPSGGTGPFTYSWNTSPVQTTQTATALCAGSYTVTVTDASLCTSTAAVTITEQSVVIDNPTITDANCLLPDGSISVAPTGGAGPGSYSFLWSGPGVFLGQGTTTITNLISGAYTLVITTGATCTYTFNYLVNNLTGPALTMSHTSPNCTDACNGTASVVAAGGTPAFTYSWSPNNPPGNSTPNVTGLCGTITYTVTVTDASGCISLDTATVFDPEPIAPNPVITNESCGGACDGTITLNPTGGAGGYSYSWTPALPAIANQSGLCAGSYTVVVTDVNGCDSTLVINITAPPLLMVSLASTNVSCNGDCDGTATATISGGTPGPGGYNITWNPLGPVLPNIVNLCPGQYIITATDANACIAKDTVNITEPIALTATTSQMNISCNNICDGGAIVTPSGGTPVYSFNWQFAGSPNNDTASALCPGTYNVIVTDGNGCTISPPAITITEPTPIVPAVTFTNPLCNATLSGTATSAATGGTPPYSYNWEPGSPAGDNTASVTGLGSGTYTLTVTDSMGCSNNQVFTLTDPAALSVIPSSTPPECNNGCDGTATATPLGGTANFSYDWSNNTTAQTAINLCPGTYTVIVTDANSCTDTATIVIANPAGLDVAISSTPAACNVCDGTISVNVLNGTPAFTYAWSPAPGAGQGTPNVSAMCADIYTLIVTDVNGCDSAFTITLNNSSGVTGETVSTIDPLCFGDCNGSGSVVPIGGTLPISFLWSDTTATANDTALNLCAGNYLVTLTDANNCIHFSPVTINQPVPLAISATVTTAVCSNVCTGAVSLVTSGGTGAHTYSWSPAPGAGQGTPNVTGLCPGSYTVTVTDANNCVILDTFTIGQSTPLIAAISSANISCSSACTGVAAVNITSGTAPYSFMWNDPSGQTNDTATALCAGSYTVAISDALGCSISLDTTIAATPPVFANAVITNAACGLCDGSAVLAPSGGTAPYSYVWSNGDSTTTSTGLCAGLYSVNITDSAGCTTNFSMPVSNTNGPTGVVITSTNVNCNGGSTGAVTAVTPSGGIPPYSFLWIAGGQTTQTLSGLTAGIYYVEVTDSMGCSLLDSVTITEPAPILANQVLVAPTCGASDGSITINPSGGLAPYVVSPVSPLANLAAGIYSVQITDNAGCVANVVIPLNNQNAASLSLSATNVTCNGLCNGTATVLVSGGTAPYQYNWNDVGLQTTPTATALCEGSYAVTVESADGCIAAGMISVTEPSPLSFSVANAIDPLCNADTNGMITVIPSGGTLPYAYAWSPGTSTGDTLFNVGANSYTVTLTDANGCLDSQTVVLTEPPALVISSVSTDPTCNALPNGSVDVTISGGVQPYTFAWTGSSATTEDLNGILFGTYIVNVTDANGCTIADTSVLVPVQTVTVFAGNDTTFCQSGSVILTASSATATSYQWFQMPLNTNTGNSASIMVTPPTGITGYYVVADNGTGCQANDTIMVTSPPAVSANAIISGATCGACDGSVVIAPTGGTAPYTYLWSNGDTLTSSSNMCAGLYTVDITDSAGCVTNVAIPVSNTSGPTSVAITSTNINCNGNNNGAVTSAIPSGGVSPYSFLWITGGQTTPTIAGLTAGTYYLEVTDSNNCSLIDSVVIAEPSPIIANASFVAPGCGASDGSITVSPIGGSGVYTFLWSPGGEVTATISGKPAGIYSVVITDNTGCSITAMLPLNSQNAPGLAMSSVNVSCNSLCDGTATVVVNGTATPYTLSWNDPASQNGSTATGLCEGSYAVTATGTDGCTAVGIVNITQPTPIAFSVANTVEPVCNGNTNGMITVIPSGGTLPYTYSWSTGTSTADTLANIGANSYTVTVADGNGCSATQTVVITEPSVLAITSTETNPSCNTLSDGAIDITVTGGTPAYTYQWSGSSSAVTEDLSNLASGSYILTVTDASGCTVTDSSVLVPNQTINVFAGNDTTFCQSGSITLTAISATASTYQWFQLPGNTSSGNSSSVSVTPPAGTTSYYVLVDNGSGCFNSDTITISSNTVPFADAGADATIITGTSTVIGGSPTATSGNTISWTPLPGLDNSTASNPVAQPSTTTTYTVTVTSPEGCTASDSVLVTVLPTIFIPDGISPNSDGDNDEWIIDGIELFPNCVVEVYNRWGELLFQSVGYKERWKGTFNGKELPVGTYYYVIDLKDPLFPDVYTGPITILR